MPGRSPRPARLPGRALAIWRRRRRASAGLVLELVLALFAAVVCVPTVAGAQPAKPVRLGLTPVGQTGPYVDLTMDAGTTRSLDVAISNGSDVDVSLRTYVADAYSMVNGGFAADLFGRALTGTATWLAYPTKQITLAAGRSVAVPLTVTVPAETAPGQFVASLVAENLDHAATGTSGMALDQVNRVAIAVAIEVPGPNAPGLSIGDVAHKAAGGMSFVSFAVQNPGNVHLKPSGRMTVRRSNGSEVLSTAVVMDSVYAGMDTRLEVPIPTALAPGSYCAALELSDPATGVSDSTACLPFVVGEGAGGSSGGLPEAPQPGSLPAPSAGGGWPQGPLAIALLFVVLVWLLIALLIPVRRRRRRAVASGSDPRRGR